MFKETSTHPLPDNVPVLGYYELEDFSGYAVVKKVPLKNTDQAVYLMDIPCENFGWNVPPSRWMEIPE